MAVLSDPISDFLTRFKNASRAGNESFSAPHSNVKEHIAEILKNEGYIWNFEVKGEGVSKVLECKVKYSDEGKPVLTDLKRISKPGLRQYVGAGEIPRVLNGLGITILSTSKGVLSGGQAKKQNLGGEIIAKVW
ncbi:30S ribosomal protein S8 [Persicirhabdus sediminis]|uniref:Small ribosomal subunit protein uS8 n=1 Tax=Persicirhabdus sediminis TaxID=454144 RepID=A0A8J7MFT1_9BACT|nr:30S ribosomal protein S8 [Persicirhabdus sediminis]MBK1792681.1 30S ribosomal protein S8 [Persicirhabdus sediminis]